MLVGAADRGTRGLRGDSPLISLYRKPPLMANTATKMTTSLAVTPALGTTFSSASVAAPPAGAAVPGAPLSGAALPGAAVPAERADLSARSGAARRAAASSILPRATARRQGWETR
jgi:hypothetical protein